MNFDMMPIITCTKSFFFSLIMQAVLQTFCLFSSELQPGSYSLVYGDIHLKNLLESFVRVGYRILVPDFYLVLHCFAAEKAL